jgi:CHASE3 domain sensor protein
VLSATVHLRRHEGLDAVASIISTGEGKDHTAAVRRAAED